ncbi:acetyl-CoA carboxylase [Aureococcus anophagefferens]|nr:acetyl-CoA carboxylase [Aureococcus anophagefferens]
MASPADVGRAEAVDAKVADDFVPSPFAKRRATRAAPGPRSATTSSGCWRGGGEPGRLPGSLKADELVWADDAKTALKPAPGTPPGTNKVGMVAWHMTLKSAEYPSGRELVVIANDVTFQSGSFGVPEDDVYKAASPKFKVKWNNEANPGQGFEYVYLDRADYEALEPGTVLGSFKGDDFVLSPSPHDATASAPNLRGSGTIAGETSRAYQDGFTLSYVTGRSVGIGAYLVRLGQRTIQMNAAR